MPVTLRAWFARPTSTLYCQMYRNKKKKDKGKRDQHMIGQWRAPYCLVYVWADAVASGTTNWLLWPWPTPRASGTL